MKAANSYANLRCPSSPASVVGRLFQKAIPVLLLVCGCTFATQPLSAADLTVTGKNNDPVRLTEGPDGRFYVTDPIAGSVFIYDSTFSVTGEIHGVDRPLGIAVDSLNRIFVGCASVKHIKIYTSEGDLMGVIAEKQVEMPNDMAFDLDGNLYVADSLLNHIAVFDSSLALTLTIGTGGTGDGELRFPSSVAVAYRLDAFNQPTGEVFVADQGNFRIQVYDMNGNFLRKMGTQTYKGMSTYYWQGYFNTVQSLQIDDLYRIHAADSYMSRIQILDAQTGAYSNSYGDAFGMFGSSNGTLYVPLDIQIAHTGLVAVANSGMRRVEYIYTNQQTRVLLSSGTVQEGAPTQTVVGALSTEPASASNLFILVSGHGSAGNAYFTIAGSNLVTAAVLDREATPTLSVRIKAVNENSVNLMCAEMLTVTVGNSNESPTAVTLSPAEVYEGRPVGTVVGQLVAADPDIGDIFTFSLVAGTGDSGNGSFSVSGSNLLTAVVFDYLFASNYSIRVRVDDAGGLSATSILAVAVIKTNVFGDADHNANGIPDWWEYDHTGMTTGLNSTADSDADGMDNWSEWIAFTDPTDGSQYFQISAEDVGGTTNGLPVLVWPSASGRAYDILWTSNLVVKPLAPLLTNIPATPPMNVYTDEVHVIEKTGFYRIKVKLAP